MKTNTELDDLYKQYIFNDTYVNRPKDFALSEGEYTELEADAFVFYSKYKEREKERERKRNNSNKISKK